MSDEKTWVNFKYERLPSLCYWCGCLNHDDRNCDLWMESNGTLSTEQQQFRPYLSAPPFKTVGKDVIYVPGFFEKTNRRSQWGKRGEEEVQVTSGGNSATVKPMVEAIMDCEMVQPGMNKVTVTQINAQCNTGKESVTGGNQSINQSTPKGKEILVPNLGSIDVDLHSAASVIDHANYDDNTLLEKAGMVTEKEFVSSVLISDPIINANPSETKEVEAKSNTLVSTLASPSHEYHVPFNLEQTQLTPSLQPRQRGGNNQKILGHGSALCANLALMRMQS